MVEHEPTGNHRLRSQNTGAAQRTLPLGPDENAGVDEGSVSGARFPGDRWKAMIAPARSNSVGSGPIAGFMIDERSVT